MRQADLAELDDHDCGTCSGIHGRRVIPLAGIPPRCTCGWTPHSGYTLDDHLRDMTTDE